MAKLIVAFRNVANASKNARIDMWVLNGSELIETSASRFTFYLLLIALKSVMGVVLRNMSPSGR